MLTGKAKTDYQRDYMRQRRGSNKAGLTGSNSRLDKARKCLSVQPNAALHESRALRSYRIYIDNLPYTVISPPDVKTPDLDADGNPVPNVW